jgi:acetyl esterase/lipase
LAWNGEIGELIPDRPFSDHFGRVPRRVRMLLDDRPLGVRLMIKYGIATILAAVSAVSAFSADDRFERWDRNHDGRLVRQEIPEGLRANFDRVDLDADGFIDLEEHLLVTGRSDERPGLARIRVIPDIDYAGDGNPRHRLTLALPLEPAVEGLLPIIVYIHGGAWMEGDHRGGVAAIRSLVATGRFAGASIGYRLTGEAGWPAQIHDCKAAIRWIRSHAAGLGVDPAKIAVMGHSAGGHLSAMLGVAGAVEDGLEGDVGPHAGVSSRVAVAINFFGPSDLLSMQSQMPENGLIQHDAPDSPESRLLRGPLQSRPDQARSASPRRFVDALDPPMLLIHGDRDRLIPFAQSVDLAADLKQAGVEHVFVQVAGGGHGGFGDARIDEVVRRFLLHQMHQMHQMHDDGAVPERMVIQLGE